MFVAGLRLIHRALIVGNNYIRLSSSWNIPAEVGLAETIRLAVVGIARIVAAAAAVPAEWKGGLGRKRDNGGVDAPARPICGVRRFLDKCEIAPLVVHELWPMPVLYIESFHLACIRLLTSRPLSHYHRQECSRPGKLWRRAPGPRPAPAATNSTDRYTHTYGPIPSQLKHLYV